MKREDNLYTSQLEAKCRSAIKLLEEDNAELESLKEKINTIVSDEKNKGNSSNKLKNYLKDFYIIVGLTIETNNSSIDDLKELIVELSESQNYDGSLIWTCYERNKKAMTEHRMLAFKARLLEVAWSAPWILVAGVWSQSKISNPYTAEVEKYTSMANAEEELMNIFKGKMEDFDSFNARTSEYLFDGNELRNTIGNTLRQIIMQKEEGTYVPGVAVICLRNLALSNNKECNMASAKVIESDEYGQCLIDSKFHDDPDVRELENINSQMESYDNMVNSGNTAASEAAKKHMNPNQMSSRKKEVIRKILQKTNHSEEYVRTFDEVSEEFDCNQLEELMWHWIKVDDMPSLEGVEIPYSWSEEVKRDASFVRWMSSKGYDNEKISYYYDEHILGCATVLDSLTGSCICEEEWRVASIDQGKENNITLKDGLDTIKVLSTITILSANDVKDGVKDAIDVARKKSNESFSSIGKRTWDSVKETADENITDIPGRVVNGLYSLSRGELSLTQINEQYSHNIKGWKHYKGIYESNNAKYPQPYDDNRFYIEYQNGIHDNLFYGKYMPFITDEWFDVKNNGTDLYGDDNLCETIAVYNVITYFGEDVDYPKMIERFSLMNPAFQGNWGTSPNVIREYLNYAGYETHEIDMENLKYSPDNEGDFENLLKEYDAFILTDWNGDNASNAIHTMAITVQKEVDSETGEIEYYLKRHNDKPVYNFTPGEGAAGLYNLLCNYSNNKNKDSDEVIQVIGIKK